LHPFYGVRKRQKVLTLSFRVNSVTCHTDSRIFATIPAATLGYKSRRLALKFSLLSRFPSTGFKNSSTSFSLHLILSNKIDTSTACTMESLGMMPFVLAERYTKVNPLHFGKSWRPSELRPLLIFNEATFLKSPKRGAPITLLRRSLQRNCQLTSMMDRIELTSVSTWGLSEYVHFSFPLPLVSAKHSFFVPYQEHLTNQIENSLSATSFLTLKRLVLRSGFLVPRLGYSLAASARV
jgi:hypothetical protein